MESIKKQLTPPRAFKGPTNKSKGIFEDHSVRKSISTREGTITKVPVNGNDITNKTYVDSVSGGAPEGVDVKSTGEVGGTKFLREDGDGTSSWQPPAVGALRLDQIDDPNSNKVFMMNGKGVAFEFTNPTGAGGGFLGAFNIEAVGAFTGDLLHLHQLTGNPGAGTHLLHLTAADADVIPIAITSVHATGIDMGSSKIVALVDPTSNQEAATKKYVDDNDHLESHNAASHSDITSTGTDIDSAVSLKHASGSDDQSAGDFSHNSLANLNAGTDFEHITQTQKTALHAQSHDIASHSDTTATGAELNTLTDGSDTTLHDHDGISENTTHRSSDGSDHSDVVTNSAKVSFSKTNVKATINHGGTSGTSRPTGFDSVEWIGTVEPTNATNDDTWIDTS